MALTPEQRQMYGAMTAQRFLLENISALMVSDEDDPVGTAQATAKEIMRRFEDTPAVNAEGIGHEEADIIRQQGVDHMERFWRGVVDGLKSEG